MGAWGSAVFEHDAALDWIDELGQGQSSQFVTRSLRAVGKRTKILEADDCAAALAAAETVAAGLGRPCRGLPETVTDWLETKSRFPNAQQIELARQAVNRIGADSELADLWEGDRTWKAGLRRLQGRLADSPKRQAASSAKRPKSKAADVAQKADDRGVSLAEVRKIVRARKGGLTVFDRKPYSLGLDNVLLKDMVAVANCADCASLENLDISGSGITDRVMECVGRLPNLEQLVIDAPNVSDDGLRHLAPLKGLQDLAIERAKITDHGLQHLAKIKSLTRLRLCRVKITDKGLKHLDNLNRLERLHVVKASVTANGLRRFAKRVDCFVDSDCLK